MSQNIVVEGPTGRIIGENVEFPREEALNKRQRELELVVKLLNNPDFVRRKVQIAFCDETTQSMMRNRNNKNEFLRWMITTEHKVNGEINCWSNGFLGSRWADIEIAGKVIRIAIYTRSGDKKFTNWDKLKGIDVILNLYEY
jgi:hypothetical protein